MAGLRAKEERHIKEEPEIFDLLRKDKLTKAEEQKIKLAAKELYQMLTTKKRALLNGLT